MKKFLFVSLIMAVVITVLINSCASSGSRGPAEEDVKYEWFITRDENGLRAKYNQIKTRKGETFVYINFPAREADFEKIKLDFTIDRPVEVEWMAVNAPGMVVGAVVPVGTIDKGPIETGFDIFTQYWYRFNENEVVEASKINNVVLRIKDPEGGATFRMIEVSFIGLAE